MAEIIEDVKQLGKLSKEYLDVKLEIAKSQAKITASDILSTMITGMMVAFAFIGALVILSFGLAFTVGKTKGDTAYGFYVVGGGFLVLSILLFLLGRVFLKKYIQNEIIRKLDEDI
jgi:hypothetical protein